MATITTAAHNVKSIELNPSHELKLSNSEVAYCRNFRITQEDGTVLEITLYSASRDSLVIGA